MTVRTKQLAAPQAIAGAGVQTSLYTCPAGRRTIVKRLNCISFSAAAAVIQFGVKVGGATWFALRNLPLAAGVVTDSSTDEWLVLNAGDVLAVQVNIGTAANVSASGAELVL